MVGLEGIMLSEITQKKKKTNAIISNLDVESFLKEAEFIDIEDRLMVARGRGLMVG